MYMGDRSITMNTWFTNKYHIIVVTCCLIVDVVGEMSCFVTAAL